MKTLALHIIARNSEESLKRTLDSVEDLFEQIIVVDTGSEDRTIEVAKSYGAEVYEFEWIDDFSAARNFALCQVTCDWAMWLDTGDVIKPESLEQFKKLKTTDLYNSNQIDLIWVPLNRKLDEEGRPLLTMVVPRIARMSADPIWERPIHESITTRKPEMPRSAVFDWGEIDDPFSDVIGGAERNLRILQRLIDEGDTNSRTKYYLGQEFYALGEDQKAIDAWADFIETNTMTWERYNAFLYLGRGYYNLGNKIAAAGAWLNAIGYDPKEPDAWFDLGFLFKEIGEEEKANVFFQACVGMKPSFDGRPRDQRYYANQLNP